MQKAFASWKYQIWRLRVLLGWCLGDACELVWRFLTSERGLADIFTLQVAAWERLESGPVHILKRHMTSWDLLGELLEVLGNVLGSLKWFLEGLEGNDLATLRQGFETIVILRVRDLRRVHFRLY